MAGLLPAVLDRAAQRLTDSFSLVGQDLLQQVPVACNHSNGHSGLDSHVNTELILHPMRTTRCSLER